MIEDWNEHKNGRLERYVADLKVTCKVFVGLMGAWEYAIYDCDSFEPGRPQRLLHGIGMDKNHARDMADGQVLALENAGYRNS